MPAPMPFEAPVTIATLPLRSLMDWSCSVGVRIGPRIMRVPRHRLDSSTIIELWCGPQFCKGEERGSDFRQTIEIRAQHAAVEKEIGEFFLADDFDQARGLEFLEVVGQRRGAHLVLLVQRAARGRPGAGTELPQHLEAPRLGERAGDARELSLGKARSFCGGGSHSGEVITSAPIFQPRIRRLGLAKAKTLVNLTFRTRGSSESPKCVPVAPPSAPS